MELFERRLEQLFKTSDATVEVARKMLQKAPRALMEVEKVAADGSGSRGATLWSLRQRLVSIVSAALKGQGEALPNKIENYISFLDLESVLQGQVGYSTRGKVSTNMQWHSFLLKGFDVRTKMKYLTLAHSYRLILTALSRVAVCDYAPPPQERLAPGPPFLSTDDVSWIRDDLLQVRQSCHPVLVCCGLK